MAKAFEHVQRRVGTIARAAQRLAVQGNHALGNPRDVGDPAAKALLEDACIEQAKHAPERVMRGRAVLQNKVFFEPVFVVAAPLGHVHPVVRPAQHRAQRHHDHLLEIVALRRTSARIGQERESFYQHQFHLQ